MTKDGKGGVGIKCLQCLCRYTRGGQTDGQTNGTQLYDNRYRTLQDRVELYGTVQTGLWNTRTLLLVCQDIELHNTIWDYEWLTIWLDNTNIVKKVQALKKKSLQREIRKKTTKVWTKCSNWVYPTYLVPYLEWTKISSDKFSYCLLYLPILKVWTFLN